MTERGHVLLVRRRRVLIERTELNLFAFKVLVAQRCMHLAVRLSLVGATMPGKFCQYAPPRIKGC